METNIQEKLSNVNKELQILRIEKNRYLKEALLKECELKLSIVEYLIKELRLNTK